MQKIKKTYLLVATTFLLTSCSEYQKVLNRGSSQERYKMATKLYEGKKFGKALRLLELATPAYRGKPQMERIQYMIAQSNFNKKDYVLSGYYFEKFKKNYPKSSKSEEASYLSAFSYYKDAPRFSLDKANTDKAIEAFQSFIDQYPDSKYISDANKYYKELQERLERKSFEIAKTYYNTAEYDYRNYKASIAAFNNLLSEYLGTKYKEEALYYKLKAYHDYAMKSTFRRKKERIKDALEAYNKFKQLYPNSKYTNDSEKMNAGLKEELNKITKS